MSEGVSEGGGDAGIDTSAGASEAAAGGEEGGHVEAATAALEARHRIKVNGEEREVPLSKLIEMAQKGEGADAKFREVSEQRKQVEAFQARLSEDPMGALEHVIGDRSKAGQRVMRQLMADPKTRADLEALMVEVLEYESLPDDERRRKDEDRELRTKAQKADEYEQREKERELAAQTERYQQHFVATFTTHLEKAGASLEPVAEGEDGGLARMAAMVDLAIQRGETVDAAALEGFAARIARHQRGLKLLAEQEAAAAKPKPKLPAIVRTAGAGKAPPAAEPNRPRVGTADFFRKLRGEG